MYPLLLTPFVESLIIGNITVITFTKTYIFSKKNKKYSVTSVDNTTKESLVRRDLTTLYSVYNFYQVVA